MDQSIEIKVVLLEQAQKNSDDIINKIVDLASKTKELLVQQVARIDIQAEKTNQISNDLKESNRAIADELKESNRAIALELKESNEEYRKINTVFHDSIISKLKDELKEQKEFLLGYKKEFTDVTEKLEKRIGWLEKWWYTIAGGALVIGFVGEVIMQYYSKLYESGINNLLK